MTSFMFPILPCCDDDTIITLSVDRNMTNPIAILFMLPVGMFAAGFRSTLERGYQDRALYKAGAEVRLSDVRTPSGLPAAT